MYISRIRLGAHHRGEIRLEGWADGYRMTLYWLLDLYGWAMRADCIDAKLTEAHTSLRRRQ